MKPSENFVVIILIFEIANKKHYILVLGCDVNYLNSMNCIYGVTTINTNRFGMSWMFTCNCMNLVFVSSLHCFVSFF